MSDFNRNPGTVWGRPASRAETTAVIESYHHSHLTRSYPDGLPRVELREGLTHETPVTQENVWLE